MQRAATTDFELCQQAGWDETGRQHVMPQMPQGGETGYDGPEEGRDGDGEVVKSAAKEGERVHVGDDGLHIRGTP